VVDVIQSYVWYMLIFDLETARDVHFRILNWIRIANDSE